MTWLVADTVFDLVVAEGSSLYGYTHSHELLGYGEGLTDAERSLISSYPMQWEIRPSGAGHVKSYLELDGGTAPEAAATAVRMPSDAVIVIGEIASERWPAFLRGFETFAAATYPKHFRLNIPFPSLSTRNQRSPALEQFLAGRLANASTEEVSVIFRYGTDLPERPS